MNKSDRFLCETHQCPITVSGCLLRQQRNSEKKQPPAWMFNKIPGDPRCADCEQGRAVKKGNYQPMKENFMNETTRLVEQAKPKEKGPGRPPKKENPVPKTCTACGNTYPATTKHFRGHSGTPDGLEYRCKTCIGKSHILRLDFSGHTALREKLEKIAYAEYRTPELQIMAMIEREA